MHKRPSPTLPDLLEKEPSEEESGVMMSCPISSSENTSVRRQFHENSLAIPTIGSILKSNRDREGTHETSKRISLHHGEEKNQDPETKDGNDQILSSSIDISEQEVFLSFSLLPLIEIFVVGRSAWDLVLDS